MPQEQEQQPLQLRESFIRIIRINWHAAIRTTSSRNRFNWSIKREKNGRRSRRE